MDDIEEDSYSDEDENYHGASSGNDEDEDSEPLLGKWFEETLFPPEESSMISAEEALDQDDKDINEKEGDSACSLHVPDLSLIHI